LIKVTSPTKHYEVNSSAAQVNITLSTNNNLLFLYI